MFNTTHYEQTPLTLTKQVRCISNILPLILVMLLTDVDETDLTSELLELVLAERLGEYIPQLITCSNKLHHDLALCCTLSDQMVFHFYMSALSGQHWILDYG
jgi:hypothetical protein